MLNKRILTLIFVVAFVTLLIGCIPPPTNQVPVITSIPITAVDLGETYNYDVNATDPDGDTLVYSLITKPAGMTIKSATGVISWIPKAKGDYNVVVKVSDGDLDITQSFTIVVSKVSPGYTPPTPPTPPVTLTEIKASPDIITLLRYSETEQLTVIAHYSDKSTVDITLDCAYFIPLYGIDIVLVDNTGLVTAEECLGIATITVFYTPKKGNTWTDTVEVTVKADIEIDGVLSPGEWDCTTEIPVADEMGTVKVLATTDYLFIAFDIVDSDDARLGQTFGNDQISINVNPTDGESWGFPYDLIFETSADLPWTPKVNSGIIDGWNTRWFPNDAQEDLPVDIESATVYSGGKRITEWMLPLDVVDISVGDILQVGGAIDVGDQISHWYPIGLDWIPGDASTFVDIVIVY